VPDPKPAFVDIVQARCWEISQTDESARTLAFLAREILIEQAIPAVLIGSTNTSRERGSRQVQHFEI
jgi:hypothetical protein